MSLSHTLVFHTLTRITALDNLASGAHGDYPGEVVARSESSHYIKLHAKDRKQSFAELQVSEILISFTFSVHRHDEDSCDSRFS